MYNILYMHSRDDMIGYYAKRAREYEEVYHRDDPGRQQALKDMVSAMQSHFTGTDVLELACGTGYWTSRLSEAASSIVASDINHEVMDVAQGKQFFCDVRFRKEDIYKLSFEPDRFGGGMAHFLFSHIPLNKIDRFLNDFHNVLKPGAKVLISDDVQSFLDNPIRKAGDKNTYSERSLTDGSEYLIIKNFFTDEDLAAIFKRHVPNFSEKNIHRDNYFWRVIYTL